ncbi:MAG: relaxase/mobilization nuclease domain-containing protein, partial [Clostridiales Family XIII bacterium]|nr:relaxase/mobilization nuclease domain-containing protein [Clostridiales Family XIII bacterium]
MFPGRERDKGDIIAFHLRQSFKPGEIEPAEALEIGYALAEKFTHGRHAFVCAVHTDKQHIHCHIVFSAVNLDCSGKCRNPMRSMKIVRRISDHLCAEHGLSIVENPQPSRGSYADRLDKKQPKSQSDKLRLMIDNSLSGGLHWVQFLEMMRAKGCEVRQGKYLSVKIPGAARFTRVKSLGDDYTEQALRERCSGKRSVAAREERDAGGNRTEPATLTGTDTLTLFPA